MLPLDTIRGRAAFPQRARLPQIFEGGDCTCRTGRDGRERVATIVAAEPPREGHLEQVQPNLLETLVLSRRASKEGPPSRAAPQSPPPSPPEPETPSSIAPATTPSSPGTSAAVATPSSPTATAANNEEAAGGVARQKTFVQKIRELGYAPRDLYLIYSIKFAESTAYFAFSYIYAPYLSMEFGMSDIDAGILYALYGVLCSVFGLLAGPVIDSLPLRSALLLGTVPSFIARFGSALTIDVDFVAFCSISALPLGAAFGLPVFALGVRRFTHPGEPRVRLHHLLCSVMCVLCRRRVCHLLCARVLPGRALPTVAGRPKSLGCASTCCYAPRSPYTPSPPRA